MQLHATGAGETGMQRCSVTIPTNMQKRQAGREAMGNPALIESVRQGVACLRTRHALT